MARIVLFSALLALATASSLPNNGGPVIGVKPVKPVPNSYPAKPVKPQANSHPEPNDLSDCYLYDTDFTGPDLNNGLSAKFNTPEECAVRTFKIRPLKPVRDNRSN